MSSKVVIAIDGPAGAGKSTVAKLLAKRLGLNYLDTGAMYRAVAFIALRQGVANDDRQGLAAVAESLHISFAAGEPQRVLVNGEDVTDSIRTLEIGEAASAISTYSEVRKTLVRQQQEMVAAGGLTLEGRDVTTVVAPKADVRVYLTASLEERARRRQLELAGAEFQQVRQQVEQRDHRDINRDDSPLMVADGVTVIESGGLTAEQVADRIADLVQLG